VANDPEPLTEAGGRSDDAPAVFRADAVPPPTLPALCAELQRSRQSSDAFFARILPTALLLRPIAERHRLLFYLGHLEAFDWNLLGTRVLQLPSLDPSLEALFAFGIDPVDGQLPDDQPTDWPALTVVQAFCARVRRALDEALATLLHHPAELQRSTRDAIEMAIEHRLMHIETLAYMLPQLPLSAFHPAARVPVAAQPGPVPGLSDRAGPAHQARRITIPAGTATIGRPRDDRFGWDNEFGPQSCPVPTFAIEARPVTHQELRAFVRAGGYRDRSLWTDEDWQWKQHAGLTRPLRWLSDADTPRFRAAFEELPLPLDWPAQLSLAEARAYVRYLRVSGQAPTARLPSEAELHRAAYATPDEPAADRGAAFPWPGAAAQPLVHGNFGGLRHDPCPVASFPAGDSRLGVSDLCGNGWAWTETAFAPLPGFAIDPRYPGYSQPFFDGKHFVVRGAAACTDARFVRRSFRNWFQPHYPYVFATLRVVHEPA